MKSKNTINKTIQLPDGKEISIETGNLAKQADGAAIVRMGDTMILATVVSSDEAKEGVDFLPLTVSYQEEFSAAGRFPGGFIKREGRLSDYEVLISRLVDRTLRPLFPDDYRAETQILITLYSADKTVMPDALAGLAASAALSVSDIPFDGPISEVRVGKIDGELKINPSVEEVKRAGLDLIVAGSAEAVNMVEGEMIEVSEAEMLEAVKFAQEAIQAHCKVQKELEKEAGKTQKRTYDHEEVDDELRKEVREYFSGKILEVAKTPTSKKERSDRFKEMLQGFIDELDEEEQEKAPLVKKYFSELKNEVIRDYYLREGTRLDGRKPDEIRDISIEVDYLPSAHGSALFTRGETQALATATLGGKLDEQTVDGVMFAGYNKFYLHYNFLPFSTGETKPLRAPARREVGHGNLAERALKKVLPGEEENPYTIRVISDILESNGSSSMATVCAGSLALMDAGIKVKTPVSGIAMGLISGEDGKQIILSDILGDEDHLGDMDFKVTGNENGITACQIDLKMEGLDYGVLEKALEQARKGRMHIYNKMKEVMDAPRRELKPYVPRIARFYIEKDFIGAVIGPGGRQIQLIQEETGAVITIDEVDGRGLVEIVSPDEESMRKAREWIEKLIEKPEVGKVYTGIVKNIMPFGAFVEFLPGKDGLLHISEIAWEKTESVEDVVTEGDEVEVQLKKIDDKTGKFSLSRKSILPKPEGYVERPHKQNRDRRDRGDNRGRPHNKPNSGGRNRGRNY